MLRTIFFTTALPYVVKQSSMILRLWHCVSRINKIYPACAGNSSYCSNCNSQTAVQPRLRGELAKLQSCMSSKARFNPACAGNSTMAATRLGRQPVQPRLRGELSATEPHSQKSNGSTPLARGTLMKLSSKTIAARFNPACAGNSSSMRALVLVRAVQPRLRGELPFMDNVYMDSFGSTPLARGTRTTRLGFSISIPVQPRSRGELVRQDIQRHIQRRFNPARAGNSRPGDRVAGSSTVQPRSRGELDVWHLAQKFDSRFNPARAGNSGASFQCAPVLPVQPRSRGELRLWRPPLLTCCGSTPLARGTRKKNAIQCATGRFNPARAGNSNFLPLFLF